jgi:hypothetical protein
MGGTCPAGNMKEEEDEYECAYIPSSGWQLELSEKLKKTNNKKTK